MASDAVARLSLVEYARERRRDGCRVCALPPAVRTQMTGASDKKIKRNVVVAWLLAEHQLTVSEDDIAAHVNARHDA